MSSTVASDTAVIDASLTLACTTLDQLRDVFLTRDVTFGRKADGSVVSATDHAIHRQFADAIATTFAEHDVISEEGTTVSGASRFRWVIDPLDGTSNFTSGLPYWCVSVALTCDGTVVMAVIDAPDLHRRFSAVAGGGAFVDDGVTKKQLHVRPAVDFFDEASRQVPLMLTPTTLVRAREHKVALRQRVLGATALDLAFVADGTAQASVAVVPHVWDVAAGVLLVQEAGGVVLSETGVLLPVMADVEYAHRQAALIAGADVRSLETLAALVLPAERAQALSQLEKAL